MPKSEKYLFSNSLSTMINENHSAGKYKFFRYFLSNCENN